MKSISAILTGIPGWMTGYLTRGNERSVKAKKNILASFGIKGANILVNFILVPVTLNYIDPSQYGIWLTLSSILTWFSFMDIGLGNGLRNKFAESIARNDFQKAKILTSTSYALLSMIVFTVTIVFIICNQFLNWSRILNAPESLRHDLTFLAYYVFIFFFCQLILKLITSLLNGLQKPALSAFYNFLGNLLALVIIVALKYTTKGSLLLLGFVLSLSPIVIFLVANLVHFSTDMKTFRPSVRFIRIAFTKDLIGLGVQFFIIQIVYVIVFSSTNILIAQLYGSSSVTTYNIAFKYFSVASMLFFIILTPYWSAFTDAYHRNDINWIRTSIKKLIRIWGFIVAGVIIMLVVSAPVYKIWIGNKVTVPFNLSLIVAVYIILSTWVYIFVSFLNGVSKIRLQLISAIIEGILFIPVAFLFAKILGLNLIGIVLTSCLSYFAGAFWTYIQYKKLILNKALGIWGK